MGFLRKNGHSLPSAAIKKTKLFVLQYQQRQVTTFGSLGAKGESSGSRGLVPAVRQQARCMSAIPPQQIPSHLRSVNCFFCLPPTERNRSHFVASIKQVV